MWRLTVDFEVEASQIPFIEAFLRSVLPQAAERVDASIDHFRIDQIPEEPPEDS